MGTQPPPQKGVEPPIFGPGLLLDGSQLSPRQENYVTHKMTQNNTSNKVHVVATELPQLLSQKTNMFGEETAQRFCQTLFSSPRKGHCSPPLFGPCLLWPRVRSLSVHDSFGTKGWTVSVHDDLGTYEINFGTCFL